MSMNSSSSGGGGSSSGGGTGSGGGNGGGPCGACKFLRRRCVIGCIFAPYFDSEHGPAQFASVHKIFGASNVSKLLQTIPVHKRPETVVTICFEAQARLNDPVYGCVAHIYALQQQVANLQAELSYLQGHLASLQVPQPPPQATIAPPAFSISGLPSVPAYTPAYAPAYAPVSTVPGTYDSSSLYDPMAQTSWNMQQRAIDPLQYLGSGTLASTSGGGGGLVSLVRELSQRHGSGSATPALPAAPNDQSLT